MIAFIIGELAEVTSDSLILACNGIGYEIQIPGSVIPKLPSIGESVKIYTYTYVREDALGLFGFLKKDDLSVFKQLITVNGIGPKVALGILSVMSADDLRVAIVAEDIKMISKAPGVGAKTAKRMIIELKDKIDLIPAVNNEAGGDIISADPVASMTVKDDVIQALVALGYSRADALKAIRAVEDSDHMDTEMLLKQALKKMMFL